MLEKSLVLSLCLKSAVSVIWWRCDGRLFQASGPAKRKLHLPDFILIRGLTSEASVGTDRVLWSFCQLVCWSVCLLVMTVNSEIWSYSEVNDSHSTIANFDNINHVTGLFHAQQFFGLDLTSTCSIGNPCRCYRRLFLLLEISVLVT